jgi:hypothetical protein
MQRQFTISTPAQAIAADAGGRADVVYTVANASGLPNRAMVRIVPIGETRAEWLALEGENERDFPIGGIHQFTVSAKFPSDAASGRYSLRLDILSARKGGEESYAGPVVTIETTSAAAPAPLRWWIWAAAALLLLVVGIAGVLMMRSNDTPPPEEPPIVDATETVTPTPTETIAKEEPIVMATVPDVTGSAMFVTDAIDWLQGAGFRVDLRSDTSSDAPRGTVVRQVPMAGANSARGSIVRLTVADTTNVNLVLSDEEKTRIGDQARGRIDDAFAAPVKVPDFGFAFQTDFVDAVLQLQRLNLKADLDLPPNHTMNLGKTYHQNPAAGTELKSGQAVLFKVGAQGAAPYVAVVSKMNRLTPANQTMLQDFLPRLEKRRLELTGPGSGRG